MHYRRSSNVNLRKLLPIGILCSIGIAAILSHPASATTTSATITIGDMVGKNTLTNKDGASRQAFYVPFTIHVENADYYTVSLTADANLEDSSTHEVIPSVTTGTSFLNLSDNWGMHYNYGEDTYEDPSRNYDPAPATTETILPNSGDTVTGRLYGRAETKVLTIGYAAAVRQNFPAGNYRGRITVNVVAAPLDTATTLHDIERMQDMTPSVCNNTRTPSVSAREHDDTGAQPIESDSYIPRTMLRDTRDNHMYIVEKLADGNCWMTENLALAGGTTITSSDSNLMPAGPGRNAAGTANAVNYTGSYKLPASSTSGFSDNGAQNMYNGDAADNSETGKYNINYVAGLTNIDNYYSTTSHTGSYYTWLTAVAGNKGGATGDGPDATEDICPKGWQLPKGGSSGQFQGLYNKYTNKTNFDQVWHMVNNNSYVGYYRNSALADSATYTAWWSRTSNSDTNAYLLYEDTSGNIDPSDNNRRLFGFSIRCLAKTE